MSEINIRKNAELLMEMPENVVRLDQRDGRIFAILESGKTIDVTELLGKAKH